MDGQDAARRQYLKPVLVSVVVTALLAAASGWAGSMSSTVLNRSGGTPVLEVPAIDAESLLLRNKMLQMDGEKVLQFAEPFVVNADPDSFGLWEIMDAKTAVWRLFVSAPGATDINVGFTDIFLPEE